MLLGTFSLPRRFRTHCQLQMLGKFHVFFTKLDFPQKKHPLLLELSCGLNKKHYLRKGGGNLFADRKDTPVEKKYLNLFLHDRDFPIKK